MTFAALNPLRYLAVRIFAWFWLVLLLTMAGAWWGRSTSYCSTVVRNCPMGGWFSTEQLTVQAWQPMHLRMSTSMP